MSGFIPVPQTEDGTTKEHVATEWYEFRLADGTLKWPQVVGGIIALILLVGLIVLIAFLIIGFMGPPRFIKTESRRRQLTLAYGEQGQITCTVDAQPPATWTWKCGKVEINKDNPYKAKLKVTNTENESTLKPKLEYIPELFRGGGCSCQPRNEVTTHLITLHTNVALFYPPVKLHQATFRGDTTVRLTTYRDEDKGPADTDKCFFVQYKISDPEVDDEWKFAERILTNLDFDVKRCTIEKWKEWRIDGFITTDVFNHLNVGSAHFDLHGLQPTAGYDVRAMAVSLENGNVPHVRFSDGTKHQV